MNRFIPSQAETWMEDYGDVQIGKVLHALASRCIHEFLSEHPTPPEEISFIGSKWADGLSKMSSRIIDTYFREVVKAFYGGKNSRLFMEYPVRTDQFGPGIGVGRVDAFILADDKLTVLDLKTGIRKIQNVNQLVLYALAIIRDFHLPPDMQIELILVQPRSERKLTEFWTAGELCEAFWKLSDYQTIMARLDGHAGERIYLLSEKSK